VAGLTAVYALALASAAPADLATGAALASLALVLLGRRLPAGATGRPGGLLRRAVAFPAFAVALLADVARGTRDVALRVLGLRPLKPGIVLVPFGERSELGLAVSALASTLSPGSVLVDVDHQRRVLVMHVIDASDPDAFRSQQQRFYDRYQRRVFP
jgi:multisubunit Na+/H+ antiporter MnhE subunit